MKLKYYTARVCACLHPSLPSTCFRQCLRVPRALVRTRSARVVTGACVLAFLLMTLHMRVLPSSMGYYNDDCLQEERREQMRYVLHHTVKFFNENNATYWLDYGTLLGLVREGDIIPYDGDVDVSRLADDLTEDVLMMSKFPGIMKAVGINGNGMMAKYKNASVDLFRFQTTNSTNGERSLRVYYPFTPKLTWAETITNYFFPQEIPVDVIFPLKEISLPSGAYAKIPKLTFEYLKMRYPLTWYMRKFPYKWKCWTGGTTT